MADRRFSTTTRDVADLLGTLDVDQVGDIETLLILLFDWNISVEVANDDEGEVVVDVTVWADDIGIGCMHPFPLSLLEIVAACAETISDFVTGLASDVTSSDRARAVQEMGEDERVAALQDALGKVRVFNLLESDG